MTQPWVEKNSSHVGETLVRLKNLKHVVTNTTRDGGGEGEAKFDFTVNRTRDLKIFSLALSQLSYEVGEQLGFALISYSFRYDGVVRDYYKDMLLQC